MHNPQTDQDQDGDAEDGLPPAGSSIEADDIEESEDVFSEVHPFIHLIKDYSETQFENLRLISIIGEIGSRLDDPRERAWSRLSRVLQTNDDAGFDEVWHAFRTVQEHSKVEPEDADARKGIADDISRLFQVMPDGMEGTYLQELIRSDVAQPSSHVVLGSLLTSMVGRFEVLVASLIRLMLAKHPSALNAETKPLTWKEVSTFSSLDEFREVVIEQTVDDLMYGGVEKWLTFLDKRFGIASPSVCSSPDFTELLQRRHVIVHNAGVANHQYLAKAGENASGVCHGDQLSVDADYLKNAADTLLAAGVSLVASGAIKLHKQTDLRKEVDSEYTDLTYRLLQFERYGCVVLLQASCPPEILESDEGGLVRRVNTWLAHKRLGTFNSVRHTVEAWNTSNLIEQYQLAKLALLDEMESAMIIIDEIRGTKKLPTSYWLQWPLLEELRAYEQALPER